MTAIGFPNLCALPIADEVHISVVFSWHLNLAFEMQKAWQRHYPRVRLGGPAIDTNPSDFTPGLYLRPGYTITSRGCPNHCPWCLVPQREGPLRTLPIRPGYIIQDNNFLACPRDHQERVFEMLLSVGRQAEFTGGLAPHLLEPWHADMFRIVPIRKLGFAADTIAELPYLRRAREILDFLKPPKLRCFVLIAWNSETITEAEERLAQVYREGFWPYPMLYQPPAKERLIYPQPWRQLARTWSRPVLAWQRAKELGLCKSSEQPS